MQTFVKQHATETGDITFETPPIDVEGYPLLTHELIVHSIAGTSPQISAQLQTSSDLGTWSDVDSGIVLTRTTAGVARNAVSARETATAYARYVRYEITISGTITSVEYSLVLNTFASS